ncbi:LOW QUALITY PROTEIN: hypothetical protein TorRG33x02_193240 [Trema orientale]|uniref:Uncharacterized protein n=1 Tax=Trema orientale TaxID=63057 RepID=A0A2P5EHA5_TREOI|nr:LOW QUALITY PROTEIN: hypothetical protein TorRG33x02_193240 [Trema orientale]
MALELAIVTIRQPFPYPGFASCQPLLAIEMLQRKANIMPQISPERGC